MTKMAVRARAPTDHGVNVKWETWETSALHQDPGERRRHLNLPVSCSHQPLADRAPGSAITCVAGGIYSSLHMSDDVAPATASAGTECDFVMELKIPRFVVQKVFPDLAFNASAISAYAPDSLAARLSCPCPWQRPRTHVSRHDTRVPRPTCAGRSKSERAL